MQSEIIEHIALGIVIATVPMAVLMLKIASMAAAPCGSNMLKTDLMNRTGFCSNAQDKSEYLKALKNCSAVRQQYMISNLK
jgi:hypothetical protein